MSKKEVKKVAKENKESRWEDVRETYENAVKIYLVSVKAMTDVYNKYLPIIEKHPELKKLLDGGAKTLDGIRVLINKTALSHITEVKDDSDEKTFTIGDKAYTFRKGVIDENNDNDVEIAVRAMLAYQQLISSIYAVVKNTMTVFLSEVEKILNSIDDNKIKEEYGKMLEVDKQEFIETANN